VLNKWIYFALFLLLYPSSMAWSADEIVGNCNKRTVVKSSTGYLMALSARQKNNQVFGINQSIQDLLHQVQSNDSIKSFTLSTRASSFFGAVDVPMDFSEDYSCPEEYRQSTQGVDLHAASSTWLWRKGNWLVFYGGSTTGTLMVADKRLQGMGSMGIMMLYSFMNYLAPVLSRDPFGNSIGFSAYPDWMFGGGYRVPALGTVSYGYIGSSGHMIDVQTRYRLFANAVLDGDWNAYRLIRLGVQDLVKQWYPKVTAKVYYEDVFLAAPPTLDGLEQPQFSESLGEHLRGVHVDYAPLNGWGARIFWALSPTNQFQSASVLWSKQMGEGSWMLEYGLMHSPDLYFYGVKPRWVHVVKVALRTAEHMELEVGRNSLEQFVVFPYSQDSWYFQYRFQF